MNVAVEESNQLLQAVDPPEIMPEETTENVRDHRPAPARDPEALA